MTIPKNLMQTRIATASLAAYALLAVVSSSQAADTEKQGVLALLSGKQVQQDMHADDLASIGCAFRMTGEINDGAGDIGIDTPDSFALLSCETSILNDGKKRVTLDNVFPSSQQIAVIEGDLSDFMPIETGASTKMRDYFFKISHYNNLDLNKRDADLANIGQDVAKLKKKYITESFINATSAKGLRTPDEVVVI